MKWTTWAWAAGLGAVGISAMSCTGDPDLFGGGSATSTGSGTTASGTTTVTGGEAGSGGTGLSSGGGSSVGGAGGGMGGTGGTGPTCAHDPCLLGPALHPGCSSCVAAVCDVESSCCGGADARWGYRCVDLAADLCSLDCAANKVGCEDQYGSTIGYHLCDEGAATCRFGFNNLLASCGAVCDTFGGACLAAYDNLNNTYCDFEQWLTCDSIGEEYNVCVCSRGCGNGPPCGFGEDCVGGICQ